MLRLISSCFFYSAKSTATYSRWNSSSICMNRGFLLRTSLTCKLVWWMNYSRYCSFSLYFAIISECRFSFSSRSFSFLSLIIASCSSCCLFYFSSSCLYQSLCFFSRSAFSCLIFLRISRCWSIKCSSLSWSGLFCPIMWYGLFMVRILYEFDLRPPKASS